MKKIQYSLLSGMTLLCSGKNISRILILVMAIMLAISSRSFSQNTVHQSLQTQYYTLPDGTPLPTPDEMDELIRKFNFTVNYWNDYAANEGGAGGSRRFFKNWVNPWVDFALGFGGPWSGLSGLRDWGDTRLYGESAKNYRMRRDRQVRQTFEDTATKIVNEYCYGDVECSEVVFDRLLDNSEVQEQLAEADALGAFDEAQTRAYAKLAAQRAVEQYEGTIVRIDNLEATVLTALEATNTLMIEGFKQINNNQKKIIYNTAKILQVQQEHTIALQNIQNTIDANFELIHQGIGDIVGLQQVNLFLSGVIIDGLTVIDKKIDDLTIDVAEIRATQINDIFNNSPISKKIELLLDPNSTINQYLTFEQRTEMLANLKAIKLRQDIANTAKIVATWGEVGKEALSVFCDSCPEELSTAIDVGIGVANIVGNIASGNYAKAVLSVIGLFKKPEPSPELKMLMKISKQLQTFESNMNAQFEAVHDHLFAMEENLTRRLEIIDLKINQIAEIILHTREELLIGLGAIDVQLNYVINQNECIKDVILILTNQQNQDVCKIPVEDFQLALAESRIDSFQDLDNFFRGVAFSSCIQSLFDVSNVSLLDAAFFRYTQCNLEGQDNKTRADRIYEYIYHNVFGDQVNDPVAATSLLMVPTSVNVLDSITNFVDTEYEGNWLQFMAEDRYYKNYRTVLAFSEYVLSLFPFMELHDDGALWTPEEIIQNPGFSRERAIKLISILRDISTLLDHTYAQQSLMAGNGSIKIMDQIIADAHDSGVPLYDDVLFSFADLFRYNPFFRKNYSAYLLDRAIGYDRLKNLLDNEAFKSSPYRVIYKGYNILLSYDSQDNPIFIVSLTNSVNPDENIELFRAYLPAANDEMDESTYKQFLTFAYPSSITEIEMAKTAVMEKLAEMYMVTSDELDEGNADFSREDLLSLLAQYNQDRRTE